MEVPAFAWTLTIAGIVGLLAFDFFLLLSVAGILFGYAEMIEGMVRRFKAEIGDDAWVVGNERCVLFDVTGVAKYAKPH